MNAISARALQRFDEFVELPAEERERRLAELAATEPDLHAALCALLRADAEAGVLDRSPVQILAEHRDRAAVPASSPTPAPDLRVGARLGPWRIDREIGRGGMGTVYEAHRDDGQYQQRVALKCVRAELDSPQLIAAMREERNLLARLDHAGIAALVDGGVDENGRPWFALRYVEGEPIDAWCDRHRLDVAARVDLLLQVCDAVVYAHAQGVLHRDLKPSNVLVAGDGRAQLLDFGISAQIGPLREALPPAMSALTPQYAAPEARGHGAQGPATDLYALGVLGYRLLSGQWPTPLHGLRDLLPTADSGEPMPMEQSLEGAPDSAAHARGAADAATLARRLRGDLSAILLKAVATRPQDRYASVAEFADELRRWRQGRPVRVRPGSGLSRARKWLRRNPTATGLSAALILALAAGLGAAWWQHRQALREAAAGEQVGRLFASTLGTATLSGLGSTRFSSRALLERTERELRALPLADQPALRAHALATLARGYIQIGDYLRAAKLASEASRISDRAGDRDEDGFIAATRLSALNYQGRHNEALALARARLDALAASDAPNARNAGVAIGLERAQTLWDMGRTAEALNSVDALLRQTRANEPGSRALQVQALILRSNFLRQLGRLAGAEDDAQRARALATPIDPVLADNALERLVDVQRVRQSPAYPDNAQRLYDERKQNLGPSHPQTALAEVYLALSRFPRVSRGSALAILGRLEVGYGRDHPVYALALSRLAWTAARDPEEELLLQREAVAILERTRPRSEMLFNARSNLAKVLLGRGDDERPPPDFDRGVSLFRRNVAERERAGLPGQNDRYWLAFNLVRRGDEASRPLARQTLADALRNAPNFYRPGDIEWLNLRGLDAMLRYREGQYSSADQRFAQLLRELDLAPNTSGWMLGLANDLRAMALLYRGIHALRNCRGSQADAFANAAARLADKPHAAISPVSVNEARVLQRAVRLGRLPPRPPLWFPADPRAVPAAVGVPACPAPTDAATVSAAHR
ncbi:serine/threonine-protein kinase Pkn1 [Lysobacter enzymogenes]|uniref:Serine/threonine-protein kinase Pkn1 n=1 Tax=Lysobacter enzymogenes TaxID=69 RepID=A0A0S2DIW6_LYSEN|nr:serine/threonine-protein kinase [Lysobacter enzymogenes]ALN58490.1 serine/threonine-protein kinase Pkn1 [Lysobacter enzymogenes]